MRSRLAPFKKLAQTLKSHWDGILAYYPHRITSAAIESINSIIQTARRRARGFRNFENLKAICYWMAGRLELQIPIQLSPTQASEAPFYHAALLLCV